MLFSALSPSGLKDLSPLSLTVLVAVILSGLAALYVRLLPKPLPGIPYNRTAARSIWGDMFNMFGYKYGPIDWMVHQTRDSKEGPLRQVLMPFSPPFVLLSDFRESHDICYRRNEFDRSYSSAAFFGGLVPNFHMNLKTGPKWRAQRRLLQDLMSPSFLKDVAAPNLHDAAMILIDLWKEKTRVAGGKAFSATEDIKLSAFDAILALSFGQHFPHRALAPQLEHTRSLDGSAAQMLRDSTGADDAMEFKHVKCHPDVEATLHTTHVIDQAMSSFKQRLLWGFKGLLPSEMDVARKRAFFLKHQVIEAAKRLEDGDEKDSDAGIKSAVDLMMKRERQIAIKDGREPMYWSASMRDEILGFVVAGHDTTATTVLWALKFLTDCPTTQKTLRETLHAAHPDALTEQRSPSPKEISTSSIPYLDAVVEECLRCAGTVPGVDRETTQDTELMGHHIPKGTLVFMLNRGPTFTEPGHSVDEKLRSATSRATAKERGVCEWHTEGMEVFRPERWLVEQDGELAFDPAAGPNLPFGGGLRGCFGRKLAYLELKIFVTLLVWNFEFMECPEKLTGYETVDGLTHAPAKDFIKLRSL